jgi:hypothetical protein
MTIEAAHGKGRRTDIAARAAAVACAIATTLLAAPPLAAHHSFAAEFDATREVKAAGEVSGLDWSNPHAWIHLTVRELCERKATPGRTEVNSEGWTCRELRADEAANWNFELASPNGLMRQGWTRNSLTNGQVVTIEGWRARDDSPNGNARVVSTADGKRLFAGSSRASTP